MRSVAALGVAALLLGMRAWQQRDLVRGAAPALEGTTVQGERVSLAQHRAPLLVYFWAQWCGVCALQQEAIEAVAADWPVISIATQSGDVDQLRAYMAEHGLRMAVLADEDGALARRYGVRGVPTLFVLDGAGRIRFTEIGYTTGAGLRARLWWAARGWP
jgi:peroxiredoxin